MARDQGWLAEHMLILGITNPHGEKNYVAAAFPCACGKTNLRCWFRPGFRGLEGGDGRRRHRLDQARRMATSTRSIPRPVISALRRDTVQKTNPTPWKRSRTYIIFTNVALTDDGDVWWEGMTESPPQHLIDWHGKDWTPGRRAQRGASELALHRAGTQCPSLDPAWDDPEGVPISAILFGGRRSDTTPLVAQAFNWEDGIYKAATMGSETPQPSSVRSV